MRARKSIGRRPSFEAVSGILTMSNSAIFFVPERTFLRSRGAFRRPGGVLVFASTPEEGRAERRQAHLCCCRACEARPSALVRRGASHDAGRSPLGAPPWRFSAGGRASISGIASGSVQRAPRSQVVMPGGRCPGPPEQRTLRPGDDRLRPQKCWSNSGLSLYFGSLMSDKIRYVPPAKPVLIPGVAI